MRVGYLGCVTALGALLAGCGGSSDAEGPGGMPGASASTPTWHKDIAPIVSGHCKGCHQLGGIGPFPLDSYASAKRVAGGMVSMVNAGLMPPWHARDTEECKPRLPWKEDIRLSDAQKKLLQDWVEAGAPEGDPARATALPAPPSLDLKNRNVRVTMAKAYNVQSGPDIFRCFPMPYTFAEETWLNGLQVVPGNAKVVHHVLVWLDKDGESDKRAGADGSYQCFGAPGFNASLLGAWAPGGVPVEPPPDVGLRIPKGSKIVINVHYHPGAGAEDDTTSVDLRWSAARPSFEALLALPGNARTPKDGLMPGPDDPPSGPDFVIPAGVRDHTERMDITIPATLIVPAKIFGVGTHMHYVGTDMKVEIDRTNRVGGPPPGEPVKECLIQTPHWDFHWQRGYAYDAPFAMLPTVRAGDVLNLRCTYDNSMMNPHVVSALQEQGLSSPRDVRLGEQTLDEMCLGAFGIAFPARP
jgi:hypothetical protein